jgi:hypothetical protein
MPSSLANDLNFRTDSIPTLTPFQENDDSEDEDAAKNSDDPQVKAKSLFFK